MAIDATLLEVLVCPDTHHSPLSYDESAETLTCPQCRRVYRADGFPVLMLDQARRAADSTDQGDEE